MLDRDPDSVKPTGCGGTSGRPAVVMAVALALAAAPALQAASLAGLRPLNFAPDRPWSYVAYGLAAPYVAVLLWRRHPRARFVVYLFFTHEAARGLHLRRWDAVIAAAARALLLQLPSARRWAPSLRPAEVLARLPWRRRRRDAPRCGPA
jgi:hypothetical protein